MSIFDAIGDSIEAALDKICIMISEIGKQYRAIDEKPIEEQLPYIKAASIKTGLSMDEASKYIHQLAKLAYLNGMTITPKAAPTYERKKQRLKIKR